MTAILLHLAYLGAIGFCSCTVGWLILRADKNQTTMTLTVCQILIIIWCLPQLFLSFPINLGTKYFLYSISYIGISFIGPFWLMFSYFYCNRKIHRRIQELLFGLSVLDYFMFLTNHFHHRFYLSFGLDQVIYGPVFYFHMVFTYFCILLGMAAVVKQFREKKMPKLHMIVIVSVSAVPLCFNLLYLSGMVKTGFDLTPPVFALSSFLMLLAVFRYDFLNVNVVALEHIFEAIAEGVVVYNRQGKITYCNHSAMDWIHVKNGDNCGLLLQGLQSYTNNKDENFSEFSVLNGTLLTLSDHKKVQLKQYVIYNKHGRKTAGILLLSDVGEYYDLLRQSRELAVSEQRLAIEQEQNRIAQEVHDTIGHTLTMIQSLIKLIRIHYETHSKNDQSDENPNEKELREYMDQAQELACNGIRDLRQSMNHLRQETKYELVTQGVYQLTGSVKEMDIEVEIQGKDGPEYSHLSGIVYKCLREAITNCLKYAHASHMDVIMKFAKEQLNLYIFDNGQGCSSIQESNGLKGMRERVEKAGGQIRVLSAKDEGFQIFLTIPIKETVEP